MLTPRRSFIAAGAIGAASLAAAPARSQPKACDHGSAIAELTRRSEQANAALMRGDIATYLSLITVSDDFTLMSPFGGTPSRGAYSREQWEKIGAFFRNGTLKQEVAGTYATADMIVLAIIEHGHGEVGGLPAQDWPLRVTLVYRRNGDKWLLVHRHADPLAKGISLEQSAALARGDGGA